MENTKKTNKKKEKRKREHTACLAELSAWARSCTIKHMYVPPETCICSTNAIKASSDDVNPLLSAISQASSFSALAVAVAMGVLAVGSMLGNDTGITRANPCPL